MIFGSLLLFLKYPKEDMKKIYANPFKTKNGANAPFFVLTLKLICQIKVYINRTMV